MPAVIDYMDTNKKWRWGYFAPAFFRVDGDRIVAVASTKPFDLSLQFAEAFADDRTIYRNVFLVTCKVRREVCEKILDVARSLWVSEPPPHRLDVIRALTLMKI
jgi:hypothetical protein